MARDHTRVNIDIWGDDAFRDLPVDAQNLYWRLWTSPQRSYCGSHEWRPAKLVQSAGDWTVVRILAAAVILSERLFLVIDADTEECLLRSWVKHDGLWKTPNMAVSMANARSALGSNLLRGVIVHEVKKLAAAYPTQGGWKREEVAHMLTQTAINPADIPPFDPGPNGGLTLESTPALTRPLTPPLTLNGRVGVNPSVNPPPTTATPTPTATTGGYVSTEGHQRPHCHRHPNENSKGSCGDCMRRREWDEADAERRAADELSQRRARRDAIDNCPLCDQNGKRDTGRNSVTECDHQQASSNA